MNRYWLFIISILVFSCNPEDDVVPDPEPDVFFTVMDPCMTANQDCLERITVRNAEGRSGTFEFYQTYPIMNDTAVWGEIKHAIIVVHGLNRDADNNFLHMTAAVRNLNILNNTVIISPHFKANVDAGPGQLFWPLGWRDGALSNNPSIQVSTFVIMDLLLETLGNKERFPFLEKVMIAGHSSGALFAHTYALAQDVTASFGLEVEYVVANSQYFYYPQDVRFNATTQTFMTPTTCDAFDEWPMGFRSPVPYLEGKNRNELNDKFIAKKITYLLGTNDVVTTGTLNTTNCAAVVLGTHRFNRGENMFRFMETFYPTTHNHKKVTVNNIGHNAQLMFGSMSFRNLLRESFNVE